MIDLAKKRLALVFSAVLITFALPILIISYYYFHKSIFEGVKKHIGEEIQKEFVYYFEKYGLDTSSKIWEEYHFEILNEHGDVLVLPIETRTFYPKINKNLLADAFAGKRGFEPLMVNNEPYLITYFPLNEKYVGRVATHLTEGKIYKAHFLKLVLFTLPALFLVSIAVSRYMVLQAMKPISSAFEFQETFSSNISHELRSPLASLKGNLEVLLRKERTIEEYKELVRFGLSEIDRIISLLNDLHMLASSKFKPLDLYRKHVDIIEILNDVTDLYMLRLKSKKINYEVKTKEHIVCVCDEGLIRRVIENLMNNAVKYTPEGGTIKITAYQVPREMFLILSNTCNAIPKEEVGYLFEPFYRGKMSEHKKAEGKGLGLFIARYIVRSHGGDIFARLTKNGMIAFTVCLPIKPKSSARHPEE
jgi:signal transduction histidine kinase